MSSDFGGRIVMRRLGGPILVGLGVFLVVLGLLSRFYAYPALAVAPVDQNSVTNLEAPDATILDLATLREVTTDLSVTNKTTGDVPATEERDGKTRVWTSTTSIRDGIGNVRSRSAERYAFDATTGEAINCCGAFIETTDGNREPVRRTGLITKYPFSTDKQDYQFWDATLGQAVTTKFVEETEIEGLTVYQFRYEVPLTVVGTREVPGSLVGVSEPGPVQADVQYETVTEHWVEPTTGVIIDRVSRTANTLGYEGETVLTTSGGEFSYTDAQVSDNVEEFSGTASALTLLKLTVPLVGLVLGLALIVLGVFVARRSPTAHDEV